MIGGGFVTPQNRCLSSYLVSALDVRLKAAATLIMRLEGAST
jgi:hypothetical protein